MRTESAELFLLAAGVIAVGSADRDADFNAFSHTWLS